MYGVWRIHETLQISNENIIYYNIHYILLFATNCPRRIVQRRIALANCPAPNFPGTAFTAALPPLTLWKPDLNLSWTILWTAPLI